MVFIVTIKKNYYLCQVYMLDAEARVAELVDALDSKSCVLNRRAGSSPASGTKPEFSEFSGDSDFLVSGAKQGMVAKAGIQKSLLKIYKGDDL